jgi:hypothetical protein
MRVQWVSPRGEQREDVPISLFYHDHKIYCVVALPECEPTILQIEPSNYKNLYYGWTNHAHA